MKLKTFVTTWAAIIIIAITTIGMIAISQSTFARANGTKISEFENLLNVKGTPVSYKDSQYESEIAPFSDLGAWHAFSLPKKTDKDTLGGFTQPLIVRKESPRSISKSLDILEVSEYFQKGNQTIEKKHTLGSLPASKIHLKQYPGGLWQEYEFSGFTLQLDLRFVFDKTSMVKYKIINHTKKAKSFHLKWHGKLFQGAIADLGAHFDQPLEAKIAELPYKMNLHGQAYIDNNPNQYLYVASWGHKREEWVVNNAIPAINYVRSVMKKCRDGVERQFTLVTPYEPNLLGNHTFSLLNPDAENNKIKNAVSISFSKPTNNSPSGRNWLSHPDDWKWQMKFQDDYPIRVYTTGRKYEAELNKPFIVKANSANSIFVSTSFTFTSQERTGFKYAQHGDAPSQIVKGQWKDLVQPTMLNHQNASAAFDKSGLRWKYYLKNLLGDGSKSNPRDSLMNYNYQKVAVKGMETLTTNWRGHAGMLEHQGVTPSLSISWFNEFWSWDSWKQASAEVNFDPKLAMDNIKVLFDYQVVNDPAEDLKYHFDPERRKNDLGMIPDLLAYEQGETNWRDTKPPLSAWAVWNVYHTIAKRFKNQKDIWTNQSLQQESVDFLKYMYMRIMAYHTWWYLNRDGDSNGINEYGASLTDPNQTGWRQNSSENDIATAVAWESGMDNAPRFDWNGSGSKDNGLTYAVNKNNDGSPSAYILQQESVDLNSYMYAEKQYLIKIAVALKNNGVKYSDISGNTKGTKLNKNLVEPMKEQIKTRIGGFAKKEGIMQNIGKSFVGDIKQLKSDSRYLKNYINTKMFDQKTGFFYDLKWTSNASGQRDPKKDWILVNRGKGPEGYLPLWANVATKKHAKRVRKIIMDPHGFNTKMPFPTASWDNQKFEPDQYWRGPVWLDQATFGVNGLSNYGFKDDASYMALKLFNNANGLLEGAPIRENYNPITGKGLSSKGFSWSSGMYILMYQKYIRGV